MHVLAVAHITIPDWQENVQAAVNAWLALADVAVAFGTYYFIARPLRRYLVVWRSTWILIFWWTMLAIDRGIRVAIPWFNDMHIRPFWYSLTLASVDLIAAVMAVATVFAWFIGFAAFLDALGIDWRRKQ